MMFPKPPARLEDSRAIARARKPYCEICGSTWGLEVHHIFTRGTDGPDVHFNLVCLCWNCHHGNVTEGKLTRQKLLAYVSRRDRIPVDEIIYRINRIRREGAYLPAC